MERSMAFTDCKAKQRREKVEQERQREQEEEREMEERRQKGLRGEERWQQTRVRASDRQRAEGFRAERLWSGYSWIACQLDIGASLGCCRNLVQFQIEAIFEFPGPNSTGQSY